MVPAYHPIAQSGETPFPVRIWARKRLTKTMKSRGQNRPLQAPGAKRLLITNSWAGVWELKVLPPSG